MRDVTLTLTLLIYPLWLYHSLVCGGTSNQPAHQEALSVGFPGQSELLSEALQGVHDILSPDADRDLDGQTLTGIVFDYR